MHWDQPGPQPVVVRPVDLGGERHPVIVWGNGTVASSAIYAPLLRHLAAADAPNSGTGAEMPAGARTLVAENARPGSRSFGRIDTAHIGATGHSQGGGGRSRPAPTRSPRRPSRSSRVRKVRWRRCTARCSSSAASST